MALHYTRRMLLKFLLMLWYDLIFLCFSGIKIKIPVCIAPCLWKKVLTKYYCSKCFLQLWLYSIREFNWLCRYRFLSLCKKNKRNQNSVFWPSQLFTVGLSCCKNHWTFIPCLGNGPLCADRESQRDPFKLPVWEMLVALKAVIWCYFAILFQI